MDKEAFCKKFLNALDSMDKAKDAVFTLISEVNQLEDSIKVIDKLPLSLRVQKDPRWKPNLVAKLRQDITEHEVKIREICREDIEANMDYIISMKSHTCLFSENFVDDIDTVLFFYHRVLKIAFEQPSHRPQTELKLCLAENLSIQRLKSEVEINLSFYVNEIAYFSLYSMRGSHNRLNLRNNIENDWHDRRSSESNRDERGKGGYEENYNRNRDHSQTRDSLSNGQTSKNFQNHSIENEDEPVEEMKKLFPDEFLKYNNSPYIRGNTLNSQFIASNPRSCVSGRIETIFPFKSSFVKKLLFNKHIVLIGDSLTRAIYKDLLQLLKSDDLLQPHQLKKKTEHTHLGDRQIACTLMDADKVFNQVREYCSDYHLLQYLFTTRVMKDDVEKFLLTFQKTGEFPDVIVINSALWDLTRYYEYETDMTGIDPYERNPWNQICDETNSMEEYMERISILMRRLRVLLPAHTQVIWLLMPWPLPVGNSNLLNKNISQRKLHRSIYLDGNYRAAQIVSSAGYDVLDLSFYLRNHSFYPLRIFDGVHWGTAGTRGMTQLLIGHLAKNVNLPVDIAANLKKCTNAIKIGEEKDHYLYFDYSNRNTRYSDTSSKKDDYTIDDKRGAFFNKLQRDLAYETVKQLPKNLQNDISKDIQILRATELIRTKNLHLIAEDEKKLEEMTENMPLIFHHMPASEFKMQEVQIFHREESAFSY